jgi:hypothetical protein
MIQGALAGRSHVSDGSDSDLQALTLTVKSGMLRNQTASDRRLKATHADALCK